MKRIRIIPYKQGSKGAAALSKAAGGKVLKLQGSFFKPADGDLLINWGNADFKGFDEKRPILNHPNLIRQASNKLLFFGLMRGAGHDDIIPPFWTKHEDIPDEAFPVLCRTVLAGHSGAGIVIAADRSALVPASLFVKYINKKDEYRVHVGKTAAGAEGTTGEPAEGTHIIAVQRKARRIDTPDAAVNWRVRNHNNGFVFVRGGVSPNDAVLTAARTALLASGLDFGAVDVIWNEKQGRAYVLEINTAPGLEGQTIIDYADFFRAAG